MSIPRRLARRLRAAAYDGVRVYHDLLPEFVELYGGGPLNIGPVFAKEAAFLFALTRLVVPDTIVEIGVGLAGSDIAFAHACRKNGRGHLYAVDISDSLIGRSRRILNNHGLGRHVTFVLGDSKLAETAQRVVKLSGPADILFIDGDHSFEGAVSDFQLFRPLLRQGGMVLFHDTGPFSASEEQLLALVKSSTPAEVMIETADRGAVYHRPGVARAVDWIIAHNPEFELLSLHTLAEPMCGIAILQEKRLVFAPAPASDRLGASNGLGSPALAKGTIT